MSVLVSTFCRRPMIRSRLLRSFALLAGAILMASCGSDSGAPDVTGPSDLGLSGPAIDAAGRQFDALWWKQDLTTVVQVSKTIDQSGGVLTIPETGLTIEFPAGALSGPITITVTADQKYVAYKMDPAGTQFLKDVTVTPIAGQHHRVRPAPAKPALRHLHRRRQPKPFRACSGSGNRAVEDGFLSKLCTSTGARLDHQTFLALHARIGLTDDEALIGSVVCYST